MNCLLCPAPAVADCLCVECGAKAWAARLWLDDPDRGYRFMARKREGARPPADPLHLARWHAFDSVRHPLEAGNLLARLQTAKEARGVS